ncbi:hypothetical protein RCH33_2558 [Flavobacterium daejeonense]|nr:hypothetical protein RCH33_2558 [Flavobacterium daejeonense]
MQVVRLLLYFAFPNLENNLERNNWKFSYYGFPLSPLFPINKNYG